MKKSGFTLAEVLITLGIIGVVAALMLPSLLTNVNERVYNARHQNIVQKVTQAMNQMKALGYLSQTYSSTEDFVDELQRYLKIIKRCDTNLENCWPTRTVTDAKGEEFDVSTVRTSRNINKGEFDTNAVGLVLADGAHIILAYDKNAKPIMETESIRTTGDSTNVTESIAFITDVNGGRGPNIENALKDIRGFRGASFAKGYKCNGTEYKIGDTKVCNVGKDYSPVDCSETAKSSEGYKKYCGKGSGWSSDYWAGAKKHCEEMGMKLPDIYELKKIYASYAADESSSKPTLSGVFWSSSETTYDYAYDLDFFNGNTNYQGNKPYRNHVLCAGS